LSSATVSANFKLPPDHASPTSAHISYNPRRRHSKLGYLSPMAFEERAMQT